VITDASIERFWTISRPQSAKPQSMVPSHWRRQQQRNSKSKQNQSSNNVEFMIGIESTLEAPFE
jgi:hypothetical protein